MIATCAGSPTNRRRWSSAVHTETDPLRRWPGIDHSHRPTAPGIAYQPSRRRRPSAAAIGTSRQRASDRSVTLTTTSPTGSAAGPAAQLVKRGDGTADTLRARLARVNIQLHGGHAGQSGAVGG